MQQHELQIKAQEVERKKMKDQTDAQLREKQLALEDKRIEVNAELESTKLGVKIAESKDEKEYKQQYDGAKLGFDMAKSKEKTAVEIARIMKETNKSKGE
jgi:NOL1/NOP2/fmu family ribosome biogenesis protein